MAEIIPFPVKKQPRAKSSVKRKAGAKSVARQADNVESLPKHRPGTVDVYSEGHGMAIFEGCVPSKVMNAIIALLGTAGVAITYTVT